MRFIYGAGGLCVAALAIIVGCTADQPVAPATTPNRAISNVAREESVPDFSEAEIVCRGTYYEVPSSNCEGLVVTASPPPETNIGSSTATIQFSIPVTHVLIGVWSPYEYGCVDDRGVPATCYGTKDGYGTMIGYDKNGAELSRTELVNSTGVLVSRIGISKVSLIPGARSYGEQFLYDVDFDIYKWPGDDTTHTDTLPPPQQVDSLGIRIISAKGPNGGSFTTVENKIRLVAEVTSAGAPSADSVRVKWIVKDDPNDQVTSIPPANPPEGTEASFNIPKHPLSRWRSFSHKGLLSQKSLSYVVKAVATRGDKTAESQEVKVTQNEMDTMRQEYIDYGFDMPSKTTVRKSGDPGFPALLYNQLNQGDYNIAFISDMLPDVIGPLLSVVPANLRNINSGFRNPVHHRYHTGKVRENKSPHANGDGIDLNIGRRRSVWDKIRVKAISLGLCVEPAEDIMEDNGGILNHSHVDWRGGRHNCPARW